MPIFDRHLILMPALSEQERKKDERASLKKSGVRELPSLRDLVIST